MLVMTAKVDKRKLIIIAVAVAAAILGLIFLLGSGDDAQPTAAASLATNEGRVKFLTDFGWDVVVSPVESGQIRIPTESSEVFDRYNDLQKSQGYDLTKFAGKVVMRYVYRIKNYPGATDPVYATMLVYKDQVIGGDVTDTSARGVVRPFKMPDPATRETTPSTIPETQPSTT